jgi:hypothetical protein
MSRETIIQSTTGDMSPIINGDNNTVNYSPAFIDVTFVLGSAPINENQIKTAFWKTFEENKEWEYFDCHKENHEVKRLVEDYRYKILLQYEEPSNMGRAWLPLDVQYPWADRNNKSRLLNVKLEFEDNEIFLFRGAEFDGRHAILPLVRFRDSGQSTEKDIHYYYKHENRYFDQEELAWAKYISKEFCVDGLTEYFTDFESRCLKPNIDREKKLERLLNYERIFRTG